MSFLWPSDPDSDPSGVNRFGRVLHWLFTAISAAFGLGAFLSWRADSGEWGLIAACAAVTFAIGRAARYVFSGE